jgi:hypothetical protein
VRAEVKGRGQILSALREAGFIVIQNDRGEYQYANYEGNIKPQKKMISGNDNILSNIFFIIYI